MIQVAIKKPGTDLPDWSVRVPEELQKARNRSSFKRFLDSYVASYLGAFSNAAVQNIVVVITNGIKEIHHRYVRDGKSFRKSGTSVILRKTARRHNAYKE